MLPDYSEYYTPHRAAGALYDNIVKELACDGSYSDMMTVLVLSSVMQKPIPTRWPIVVDNSQASLMTKLVAE